MVSDLQADPRWIHAADSRWFAGKGSGAVPVRITSLDWIVPPGGNKPAVRPEILSVAFPDGRREDYQLLLSYRMDRVARAVIGRGLNENFEWVHDATRDPQAIIALVDALRGDGHGKDWQAHLAADALPADLRPVRVFEGEQSNSTVFLGSHALIKIIRRLEPGRSIDIELHEALARAGVTSTDELLGSLSATRTADDGSGVQVDLAMITTRINDARDGWELATGEAAAGHDFSGHAARLGTALAQVHTALADQLGTSTLSGELIADAMTTRLACAVTEVPQLAEYETALRGLFDALRDRELPAQRIHGDFHLGQTLLGRDGWHIIDFEGEPLKSLEERRSPDSPLRDVAGMIRSFGYAAASATGLTPAARESWERSCSEAFTASWTGADPLRTQGDTLSAYVADKAIYEVVYEHRNRPGWVHIPLNTLRALAAPGASEARC
ncbi:phosphotransferase [Propionibacterium australiense]|nr:phosphotransferase [Propionibacterium australiense]SYZ32356.1 Phosphotransferase enzyme family [Propionibacterium australiense]VEH90377.1 Maltokinase [Propionibacterium australiense]